MSWTASAWRRSVTVRSCFASPAADHARKLCRGLRPSCPGQRSHNEETTMRVRHGITLALLMVVSPATAQQVPEACRDRLPTDRTTIELRGADVPTTLRLLAERFRVSLLVTPDAAGLVTVNLYEVPVRDVFETIVRTAGLTCSVREGILVVSPTERLREQERKDEEVR